MRIPTRDSTVDRMRKKPDSSFSNNLLSLQLQLKTLLEDAGGDRVGALLDALCSLNRSEQERILEVFTNVIKRIAAGQVRLSTDGDCALKDFEDSLYNDILRSLEEGVRTSNGLKLEVLDGGKTPSVRTPVAPVVDIKELRKARKTGLKPVLN